MGLFGRSSRNTHPRHSAGTNSTMTDGNYNDGAYNDRNYNDRNYNDRNYNDRNFNDGTYNDRHHNDRSYNDGTYGDGSHTGAVHNTGRRSGRLGRRSGKSSRSRSARNKRPLFDANSGNLNRRPSFGTWIKYTWLDILTMVAMGAVGLGVYEADPAPTRSFPITFNDGTIVYPQFAYPLRHEIVPIWLAALLASLIPIFIILCMQIRIRSFWDVNNAIIGLLYSLIGAAVFQVFVKWLIGGLRPHFLDVCNPDLTKVTAGGDGFRQLMFTPDVCTGDRNQINDSLESMPSGHSTAAFAGFLYLYFYLNGKLKVFSNHHPAMWKLIALYAPVLGATLIAGSLTIDEYHNWYDCLAGAIIGSVFAISAYRMVYASVWDFRFNHIPLTRHTPFSYGAGPAGAGGFESTVFTRKAGWGYEEAYGGAPFDSAFALRGAGGGAGGITGNEHTIGLGSKNTGYRSGDVEHNAMTQNSTTGGIGNHSTTTGGIGHHTNTTSGLGHHNTATSGIGHNTTTGGIGHNTTTTGIGNHNTTMGGIGHHNQDHIRGIGRRDDGLANDGYNSYNEPAGVTHPTATHHSGLTHRDGDYTHTDDLEREGRSTTIGGDNRYRSHRKSLERKALTGQNRNDPTF